MASLKNSTCAIKQKGKKDRKYPMEERTAFLSFFSGGFHDGSGSKESACNAGGTGDSSSIPGSGISPGEGIWQPTPVFLPEESHGVRSLAGYNPKGPKRVRHD